MAYKFATENITDTMAKAVKVSAKVSRKQSIEVGKWLVGRTPSQALAMLSKVTTQTMAVPFTRFNRHFGHKASIGPGRYPVKTAELFIDLIKGVVANAQNEGLTTQNLVIKRVVVQTGAKSFKPSRIRGLTTKNTHVEMIVEQLSPKKDKKATAKVQPEVKA